MTAVNAQEVAMPPQVGQHCFFAGKARAVGPQWQR
jgi:hypothetical protein